MADAEDPARETETLAAAQRALGAAWDTAVRLHTSDRLKSDSKLVLRCVVDSDDTGLPATVIARRLLPGAKKASGREGLFYNEWAGLDFLTGLPDTPGPVFGACAPRLWAQDRDLGLLVLEDLGDGPPLMDVLERGNRAEASAALERFMRQLGRMHAASREHEEDWSRRLTGFGPPDLPPDDASTDLRPLLPDYAALLIRLDLTESGWEEEIRQVEKAVHEAPDFRAYTHGDAGPHNVTADGGRLFDFEFAGFRSGLLDAAGPRMAFPSAYRGKPLPPEVVRAVEAAYLEALGGRDRRLFSTSLLEACAHWHFVKLFYGLRQFVPQDGGRIDWADKDTAYFGRRTLMRLDLFEAACEEFDGLPALRALARALKSRLLGLNPDLTPLPVFGAFGSSAV